MDDVTSPSVAGHLRAKPKRKIYYQNTLPPFNEGTGPSLWNYLTGRSSRGWWQPKPKPAKTK